MKKIRFLTGLKPAQSNKKRFRDKGFWQREHVGRSTSCIKNLCHPGMTYSTVGIANVVRDSEDNESGAKLQALSNVFQ